MWSGRFLLFAILALLVQAFTCNADSSCEHQECQDYANQLVDSLNKSANPCHNFYDYVCGGWAGKNEANPGTMISTMMDVMVDINKNVKAILEKPAEESEEALKKAQAMYGHCTSYSHGSSIPQILQITKKVGGWPLAHGSKWDSEHNYQSLDEMLPLLAQIRLQKPQGVLFSAQIMPNLNDYSSPKLILLPPDVLHLPIPHNLSPIDKIKVQRQLVNLAKTFNPDIGEFQADKDALQMMALNDLLVGMLILPGGEPKPQPIIDIPEMEMSLSELTEKTGIDWIAFFKPLLAGVKDATPDMTVEVGPSLPYLMQLGKYAKGIFFSPRTIFNYEILNVVTTLMNIGSQLEKDEKINIESMWYNHDEYMPTFTRVMAAKNSVCPQLVSECYGYAMSWKYGELHHDVPKEIQVAKEMTENIFNVFGERLKTLDWMKESSRQKAEEKIAKLRGYYVYPEWNGDVKNVNKYYHDVPEGEGLLEDYVNCQIMNTKEDLKTYAKVPHLDKWLMPPLVTNAYYYMLDNSMRILEGIMQKPIFTANRLRAMNYGSLGSIIGHEITHGFDQNGVNFDGDGHLKPWMDLISRLHFTKKAECYKSQYSKYILTKEDLPGSEEYQIDGKNTANENIADNGGLQQAFWAYKKAIKDSGAETMPASLQEFTPEQVFFLSYGKMWCTKFGENADWGSYLAQDVHCPAKYRIIGSLSNFDEFSKAFSCSATDAMNRGKDACHIW